MHDESQQALFTSYEDALAGSHSVDVSDVEGNVSDEHKRVGLAIFAYFIGVPRQSYSADVGRRVKCTSIKVRHHESVSSAETVFEVMVERGKSTTVLRRPVVDATPDMCNVYGNLHGGCAAYIIDPYVSLEFQTTHLTLTVSLSCSASALVSLGLVLGFDGSGVSQSMNLQWHKPAKMSVGFPCCVSYTHSTSRGSRLRIVSTTVAYRGRIRTARTEVSQLSN